MSEYRSHRAIRTLAGGGFALAKAQQQRPDHVGRVRAARRRRRCGRRRNGAGGRGRRRVDSRWCRKAFGFLCRPRSYSHTRCFRGEPSTEEAMTRRGSLFERRDARSKAGISACCITRVKRLTMPPPCRHGSSSITWSCVDEGTLTLQPLHRVSGGAPRLPVSVSYAARNRISFGVMPVQRLNARWNALGSE